MWNITHGPPKTIERAGIEEKQTRESVRIALYDLIYDAPPPVDLDIALVLKLRERQYSSDEQAAA